MTKTIFKSLVVAAMSFAALTASAENNVWMEDFEIQPGTESAWQKIFLNNDLPVGAWQLSIALPDGLEVTAAGFPATAERKARYPYTEDDEGEVEYEHTMSSGFNANEGVYKLIVFNTKGNNMNEDVTSGPIARIKLTAAANFAGGDVEFTYFKSDYFIPGQPNAAWTMVNPSVCHVTTPHTAIENVDASKSIASVQYVNVAGQVSSTPFNGVNMVVTRYADGSTVTTKVVK